MYSIMLYGVMDFFAIACTDGDVRLFGGRNEFEGLIELCYEGDWGTVCGMPTINDSIAEVVCGQLNLSVHGENLKEA